MLSTLLWRNFRRVVVISSLCTFVAGGFVQPVPAQELDASYEPELSHTELNWPDLKGNELKVASSQLVGQSPSIISQPVAIPVTTEGGVIVVDSDESNVNSNTYVWKQLQDSPDQLHVAAGTTVPIVVLSSLTSKHCKVGDRVEARLKVDIKLAGKMVAPKGSTVLGHVSSVHPARRLLTAELKLKDRWMRANGAVGLQFDEIVTKDGHLKLDAVPATKPRIVNNKNEGRLLGVNKKGQIASPLTVQLKHQGIHLAARGAASAGGIFSMGALPVIFGLLGAADPSFAYMHPVGKNVRHRRLKGFGLGFVSGLPGGFVIADFIVKGVEAEVKPGDEFLVAFKQDFTGEAATAAALLPGATSKVSGEVLTESKKTKKDKKKKRKQKLAEQ